MGLAGLVKEIIRERATFTSNFQEKILESLKLKNVGPSVRESTTSQLTDEGMIRYYRFSVTAANELKSFGFKLDREKERELMYGMGLMLFWLRLADRVIDSDVTLSHIIKDTHSYLRDEAELPKSTNPLACSFYFAGRLLKEHATNQGYLSDMNGPLEEMTSSMADEHSNLENMAIFCDKREDVGVKLADTLLAIMRDYIPEDKSADFERLTEFYHEQFKAGMHLDTLSDFEKDYKAGITPKPTFARRAYVAYRMARNIFGSLAYIPRNLDGMTRLLSYSAVSTYHIVLDAPTPG